MKKLFPFGLTLVFFSLLLYFLPPGELLSFLSEISLKDFLLASLFYGLSHISRSLRWKLLLKDLSFFHSFLINSANVFLNNLLPARTGELSWFYYSKRLGVSLQRSVGVFLWGRLLDLVALFVLLGVFYALHRGDRTLYVLSSLLFLFSMFIHIPLSKFKNFQGDLLSSALASSLSLLSSLLKFLSLILLLGLVPSVELFLGFLGGELSSVLPIHSLGGFGTYELSFSLPQKLFGESVKEGVKTAFVFHSFLLLSSAFYGLLALYILHKR